MLAHLVNDRVSPEARGRLPLLAPALIDAATRDQAILNLVVRECARAGLVLRPDDRRLRRSERRAQAAIDRIDTRADRRRPRERASGPGRRVPTAADRAPGRVACPR